nr:thiamin pyrophosphokinase 1-like [Salvelinus alpinus]
MCLIILNQPLEKDYLHTQKCRLIETADQELTDFTKCPAIMEREIKKTPLQGRRHRLGVNLALEGRWCSRIAIGGPCRTHTTGLKWILDNQVLQFGRLVNTSNTYEPVSQGDQRKPVTVTTDQPLLWSMGICRDKKLHNRPGCSTLCQHGGGGAAYSQWWIVGCKSTVWNPAP